MSNYKPHPLAGSPLVDYAPRPRPPRPPRHPPHHALDRPSLPRMQGDPVTDCPHIATVTEPRPGAPGLVTTCVTCKARVNTTKETP